MIKKEYRVALEWLIKKYFAKTKLEKSNDVYQLADRMGFDVRKVKINAQEKIQGILLVNEEENKVDEFSTNKAIGINVSDSSENNRFTVAHELSHYIFQKMTQQNFDDKICLFEKRIEHNNEKPRDFYEQVIDYMAAAILMPYNEFKAEYTDLVRLDISTNQICQGLALKYGVPIAAINQRIAEVSD